MLFIVSYFVVIIKNYFLKLFFLKRLEFLTQKISYPIFFKLMMETFDISKFILFKIIHSLKYKRSTTLAC